MTNPTPTDWRALCARMADELDHYRQLLMDDRRETHALASEARALLTQPERQGPTDEELKAAYWEAFKKAAPCGADESWLAGLRAVARWGAPAIQPVPVSERLPRPEDCLGRPYEETDAGYCWWWFPEREEWWFVDAVIWRAGSYCNCTPISATHWLPHHALPVPQQEAE